MVSFATCLAVTLGGALGTLGRYLVGLAFIPFDRYLPIGTIFAINALGSFVIGLFDALTGPHGRFPASITIRALVMIGICGGYTTFSTFSLQTLHFVKAGAWGRASLNVALSVVFCLVAVAVGFALGEALNRGIMQEHPPSSSASPK